MRQVLKLKTLWIAVVIMAGNLWLVSGAEAAMLRLGDRNPEVVVLQERLTGLGYNVGSTDGNFGALTEAAVKTVQAVNGLEADGIVGSATWELLRSANKAPSRSLTTSAAQILRTAQQFIGVPYVWGGTSPNGFDCSGFTQYVFGLNGISLPRTADIQYEAGIPVRAEELKPGDLVFFSTYEPGPSHDGIYLGNGKFINATSSRGIAIDRMDSSYWKQRYLGARRVIR
ncbi:MAG: NlpC/P60 family protein [Pelosinus sp.]|nr:NlpC/P60 family protein [Pelosinus sp.]